MTETLIFRALLKPKVYRDLEVADTSTLYALAETIVASFDFDFDHAFGFYSKLKGHILNSPHRYELFVDLGEGEGGALGVKRTVAAEVFPSPGSKMLLLFDYGDEWRFLVELVKRGSSERKVKLPRLLVSSGKAPEQYPSFDDDEEG